MRAVIKILYNTSKERQSLAAAEHYMFSQFVRIKGSKYFQALKSIALN